MKMICLRLTPGSKLRESIYKIAQEHGIKAGVVLTCVGSLQNLNIRLAGGSERMTKQADYEILSLSGTFNNLEQGHFHISVADNRGSCFGGHLLSDNIIATTAEIVLGIVPEKRFIRERDPKTGYLELLIEDDLLR